jgi:tetratricopeptide (TPR) repeat protein
MERNDISNGQSDDNDQQELLMRLDYFHLNCKTRPIVSVLWGVLLLCTPSFAEQTVSTSALRSMARLYMAYGNYDKALAVAQTAMIGAEKQNIDGEELAMCLIDLGTVYSYQDMLEESENLLSKGVGLQKKAVGNHPYVAYTLQMLSDVYRREGQYSRAQDTLNEALSIMATFHNQQDREMLPFMASSAKLMLAQGQVAGADALYAQILDRTLSSYGPAHLQTATILSGYAEVELLEGKIDSANQRIDQAIGIGQKQFGPDHQMLIPTWLTKARIDRAAGNNAQAEIWLNKAIRAAQSQNNIVALARVHEKVNAIRTKGVYVAMTQ